MRVHFDEEKNTREVLHTNFMNKPFNEVLNLFEILEYARLRGQNP